MTMTQEDKCKSALLAGWTLGMSHRIAAGEAVMAEDADMLRQAAVMLGKVAGLDISHVKPPTTPEPLT